MILPAPPLEQRKRRSNRRRRKPGPTPPPGAALVLLEASFDEVSTIVRLTFDRAIDVASLNGSAIIVDDGPTDLAPVHPEASIEVTAPLHRHVPVSDGKCAILDAIRHKLVQNHGHRLGRLE